MGNGSKSKSPPRTTTTKKSSSTRHTGSSRIDTRESIEHARKKLLWSCCQCRKSAGMSYRINPKCPEHDCQHQACDDCGWEPPRRPRNAQDYEQPPAHNNSQQHTQATTGYQIQQGYQTPSDEYHQSYNQDDHSGYYYEDSQPGPSGYNSYY